MKKNKIFVACDTTNIKKILLGVEKNNLSAIKSYKDLGFKIKDTPFMKKLHSEILTMVWDL